MSFDANTHARMVHLNSIRILTAQIINLSAEYLVLSAGETTNRQIIAEFDDGFTALKNLELMLADFS